MAKSRNQKAKILILEHLLVKRGEDSPVSMQEILDTLAEYGITAERKSIYDDIESLREFGIPVEYRRGRVGGYYIASGAKSTEEERIAFPKKYENGQFSKDEILDTDKTMKLLCRESRENDICAFFGNNVEYKHKDSAYLQVTAPQMSGPVFFGWLTFMGKDVIILKSKKIAVSYREYLKSLAKEYKGL